MKFKKVNFKNDRWSIKIKDITKEFVISGSKLREHFKITDKNDSAKPLKEIKKINPEIEVLILSAYSDLQTARNALKYGAYDYIDKPFSNSVLREALKRGVDRSRVSTVAKEASEQLAMVKAQLKELRATLNETDERYPQLQTIITEHWN